MQMLNLTQRTLEILVSKKELMLIFVLTNVMEILIKTNVLNKNFINKNMRL